MPAILYPKDEQPKNAPQQKGDLRSAVVTIFEYVELFLVTAVLILLATLFLFRHAVVDGDSMLGTLSDSEHLIISDLFYTPKAGDIVVFESYEETGLNEPLIKRVIATEGQTVRIYADRITVDGVALTEEYAFLGGSPAGVKDYISYGKLFGMTPIGEGADAYYLYHVGEGEVFVLGDNRFNSTDSRMFGPISTDCILGRVLFRFLPLNGFGGVK